MKVFLSWSGELSHQIACTMRDWLPSVIQSINPYVSSEDIDKGTRWSTDIAHELEESQFGVICVTRNNLEAPWVNFEAGALSKTIDKSNVTPLLYNIKRSEVKGPLLQFQSTVCERDDVLKLMHSINKKADENARLTEVALGRAFEVWWPQLEKALHGLPDTEPRSESAQTPHSPLGDVLEEVLDLVRLQQRLLNDPSALLPQQYLRDAVRGLAPRSRFRPSAKLHKSVLNLERAISTHEPVTDEIRSLVGRVHDELHRCTDDDYTSWRDVEENVERKRNELPDDSVRMLRRLRENLRLEAEDRDT